jgi:hypothetical protein
MSRVEGKNRSTGRHPNRHQPELTGTVSTSRVEQRANKLVLSQNKANNFVFLNASYQSTTAPNYKKGKKLVEKRNRRR